MAAMGHDRAFGDVGSMSGLRESGHGWAFMSTRPNLTAAVGGATKGTSEAVEGRSAFLGVVAGPGSDQNPGTRLQ
jgi:hypothetical protein